MGLLAGIALATGLTILTEGQPIRRSCDGSAAEVARLGKGQRVELRFAFQGEWGACYKVSAAGPDGPVEGYLPTGAVAEARVMEQERSAAGSLMGGAAPAPALPLAGSTGGGPLAKAAELLKENQPGAALAALERILAANPRDWNALRLAGVAARQGDQAAKAAEYWRRAMAIRVAPDLEAALTAIERELSGDRSNARLTGSRFDFRYDDKTVTADQARALLPVLDAAYTNVASQLGCSAGERIAAIIQSRPDYQRTTGAAEWSGGQYSGRIHVAMLEPIPGEETQRTFTHEVVHACLARTGQWPAWLHEGLAQRLSGQPVDGAGRMAARQAARNGDLPALASMAGGWSRMNSSNARAAYAAAHWAADLLYQRYGADGVRSLLNSPERLGQISADLDRWMKE